MGATDITALPTLSVDDFNADVRGQGRFVEYTLAPWASTEAHYQNVVIVSEHVAEPTMLVSRSNKQMGLIVPNVDSLSFELARSFTRMHATYFGLFTFGERELLAHVRESGVGFV